MPKKENKEIFLKKSHKKHGKKYNYKKVVYRGSKIKVTIICPIHGEFYQIPSDHYRSGCDKCGKITSNQKQKTVKRKDNNNKKSLEDRRKLFLKRARKIHKNKYRYFIKDYINYDSLIRIECPKHGIFSLTSWKHISNKRGCKICGKEEACKKRIKSPEQFLEEVKNLHGKIYDYSDTKYIKSDINIKIKCKKHGYFYQTPHSHLKGQGCPTCGCKNKSKLAQQWLNYISKTENINIQHMQNGGEFKIGKYKVDGYCEATKTVYEFHGSYWHGDPKIYKSDFVNTVCKKSMGELYKSTKEREKYILAKGYKLITMWEDDWYQFRNTAMEHLAIAESINKSIKIMRSN